MKKVAPLRYGVIFKKAFCDVEIFTAFVEAILGIRLEIDHVETEKSFAPPIGHVAPVFDLYAEDHKQRIVVDIQHVRHKDHYQRFLYYHCTAMLEQIRDAYDYRAALTVYTIVVLTSGDKHQCDVATLDFDPKDRHGKGLGEIKHKIIYLCPKYVNDETPAPYREWLRAIDDSLDEQVEETTYHDPLVLRIFDYIEQDRLSPAERTRLIDEYHHQQQFTDGKDLGFFEGDQSGFVRGLAEGREEGLAEGIEKGARQARIEAARRMLAKGLEAALVAEVNGLSLAQVNELNT